MTGARNVALALPDQLARRSALELTLHTNARPDSRVATDVNKQAAVAVGLRPAPLSVDVMTSEGPFQP